MDLLGFYKVDRAAESFSIGGNGVGSNRDRGGGAGDVVGLVFAFNFGPLEVNRGGDAKDAGSDSAGSVTVEYNR